MLRTMVLFLRDRTKVLLREQLVGQWAECLPKDIANCCPDREVEIDLDGVTCADRAGEKALLPLSRAHRHFVCTSLFARALCEGLRIPVEGNT